MPAAAELEAAQEASIVWLISNREEILDVQNPALWFMLQQIAEISSDSRVQHLFEEYFARYYDPRRMDRGSESAAWAAMFNPSVSVVTPYIRVSRLQAYNRHLIYAINCDSSLGREPSIARQNQADYCGNLHFLKPTCTTHQLMGIRFLQRGRCGNLRELEATANELAQKISLELILDPRVVDVYFQRVWTLLESGRADLIRNIWIRRVLDSQLSDGGWANFDPIIPIDSNEYIGFGWSGSRTGSPRLGNSFMGFTVGKPISTFHATAQGAFLVTLLHSAQRSR